MKRKKKHEKDSLGGETQTLDRKNINLIKGNGKEGKQKRERHFGESRWRAATDHFDQEQKT